jgi:hypothetical protein
MSNQLTSNAEALRLFFTEDIYLGKENAKLPLADKPAVNEAAGTPLHVQETSFNYLGKNQKNILILVNDDLNEVSSAQGRELLRNLLKAIGWTANDFALVNYAHYKKTAYAAFETFFNCKLVLAFGLTADDLGLPPSPSHRIVEQQGAKMIFTNNLHDLAGDQASKKILWDSLQQLI